MNIFQRFYYLVRGFFSLFIGRVEQKNPEIAYENALQKLTSNYMSAKQAASTVLNSKQQLETRLNKEQEQLNLLERDLQKAVEKEDDEAAVLLIQRKENAEIEVSYLANEVAALDESFKQTEETLHQIKSRIQEVKRERERVVANIKTAQAKVELKRQLDGISNESTYKAIETARNNANRLLAEVKVDEMLDENNANDRLQELRTSSERDRAFEKLSELKSAHQKRLSAPEENSE